MRVLWFSNTPANADEYFNKELKGTGGWLKALDQSLQKNLELHVAFYHDQNLKKFQYEKTRYYPIFSGEKGLFDKFFDILLSRTVFYEDVYKYLAIINDVKPDLIHIHGTENPFGYLQDYVDIPVCISIQGNITVWSHKYFSGLERKFLKTTNSFIRRMLGVGEFNAQYKSFSKMKKREQDILRNCKYILGRTNWDYHITRIMAPDSEYFHAGEVLRQDFYDNTWRFDQNRPLTVFTTTGNSFYKGFETLCYALKLLMDSAGKKIKWCVAGISESDSLVKATRKKLGKLYPKNGLYLLGRLGEMELIEYLLDSSIYVMPSHIENSPNNLCEAMILGMPCIATFAGGTGSLMEHGNDGLLIQDGDPWAMAGAILELLDNHTKSEEMGKAAQIKAMVRHDKKRTVHDFMKIYESIKNRTN